MPKINIFIIITLSFLYSEYNYSLEDLNSSSEFYGTNVGPYYFSNEVTIHYFGHYG